MAPPEALFGRREPVFLASVTLPWQPMAMVLTPAEKQQRYRDKLKAQAQTNPEAVEIALMAEVERAERGELSEQERDALADKLADLAMRYLWRAKELSQIAMKLR
jgi:hypothetical protein